jgi:signal transduction histidine kinase
MGLVRELRSRIQYKIIIPFLLLTLLVALVGSALAFLFIAGSAQERLNNQLAQVARAAGDSVVRQESANLVFLREVAFASANPEAGAPAVASALAARDIAGLERALDPYFRIAEGRGIRIGRLIAFDDSGRTVVDWQTDPGSPSGRRATPSLNLGGLWFVPQILAGRQDSAGDKYAGLLDLGDGSGRYLFTAVPVNDGQRIVGGLIVGIELDALLQDLAARSQAALVTVYEAGAGYAFASTASPVGELASLDMRPELLVAFDNPQQAIERGVFDTASVNEREYQLAFAPLQVRGAIVGIISVGLASDYVVGPWAQARGPLILLTVVLMLAIIGLGIVIARAITRPLKELVDTAQAVTAGDLARRSQVSASDEVGVLSDSFNAMTAHLLELYRAVRAEAGQRAAIVESIADGVVVCDGEGQVLLLNSTARALLGLGAEDPGPARFSDIPLAPLGEAAPNFGQDRLSDLYHLNDNIVRVVVAPVRTDEGLLGSAYVLQDMTSQVAIDRAKTNFIATISHELRTPLTVLGGNADLLLRGLVGPLSDEQRGLIDTMRGHTQTMTTLINNVIIIAGLDSGSMTIEIEPVELGDVLSNLLWPVRRAATAKGLALEIDVPDDLPQLMADEHQLRVVLQQLLDNACRYSDAGTITVAARAVDQAIRVDVSDCGRGIGPDLRERLFTRFSRGDQGINSAERGIGLGLAIARELIERQGGAIWLENTSDSGTTFSFTLPAAPGAADSTTDVVADDTAGATADVAAPIDTDAVAQAA